MEFLKNLTYQDNLWAGQVWFELFARYLNLGTDESAQIDREYICQCAIYLNTLSERIIDRLCVASINYCNTFLEDTGRNPRRFGDPREVLDLINPITLIIPEMLRPEPLIHLELRCEWEDEHSMEWIIRNDQVVLVSAFEWQDPWDDYKVKDEYNFAC